MQNSNFNRSYLETFLNKLVVRVVPMENGLYSITHDKFPNLNIEARTESLAYDQLRDIIAKQFADVSLGEIDDFFRDFHYN